MSRARSWNSKFGAAAEQHAANWLSARGLTIETRGYRCSEGELDIVARAGPLWIVVEVKARSSRRWGGAAEAVGWRKRRRILAATRRYLWERDLGGVALRFDVVSIHRTESGLDVEWTRDAFRG